MSLDAKVENANTAMSESEFNDLADALMLRIESALERLAADLDFERPSDKVLEIEFPDGGRIIINRHDPSKEIWLAARSGGFHFRWEGHRWRSTRGGEELLGALSRLLSEQLATPVDFS